MHNMNDLDDKVVNEIICYGKDLLRPYFGDEKELTLRLKLITEAAFAESALWNDSGCHAFHALVHGLTYCSEHEHKGARSWAELLEPLVKRLL